MTIDEKDAIRSNISRHTDEDPCSLSLQELDVRVALLLLKIDRLKQGKQTKQSSFATADSMFKI